MKGEKFFDHHHFSLTNKYLKEHGLEEIDWSVDSFPVCFTFVWTLDEIGSIFGISEFPFYSFILSMSFRRLAAIANIIPKRGLEEFVNQTSTAGKDVVYGEF